MRLRKRDLALLSSVAKYYLQYKEVFNLNDLLTIFEGTEEVPVDDYTLSYIYYYILYILTKEVLDTAYKAKRDRLTYREFSIEYSQELLGELNIDRTIPVHHLGLVAYHTYVEGINAPEFAVFGYLLRRIYEIIKEKRMTSISIPIKYFDFVKDFDRAFNILEKIKDEFPEGYYRDKVYTDPEWLKKTYDIYFLLKDLENIRVGKKEKTKVSDKKLIKILLWKLYELYTFYLVARFLEDKKKYRIRKEGEKYVAEKEGKRLILLFNIPIEEKSTLRRIDNTERVRKYMGRPDVSLLNERPIIFECKYSTHASYITAGRFKVLAYTYEYDPLLAVLVYPGLREEEMVFDKEDSGTRELDKMVKEEGGVLEFEYNNHVVYMLILDPLKGEEENLSRIKILLETKV